jgi:SHS family lactate transporter-like MFS transporter
VIPAALLILYIYMCVPESRFFSRESAKQKQAGTFSILRQHGKVALFAIILMTGFNFFSHGTQDVYTTFLRVQHHFDPPTVKNVLVIGNIGAIIGGLFFGSFSQSFGRRKTIIMVTLFALPVIWFWSHGSTPAMLAIGAFLMQVCVQGAWGVVPAHLNELAPAAARGTFAGTCYQLGNLIASVNNPLQTAIAEHFNKDYSLALAIVATGAALLIATLAWLGPEAQNVDMGAHAASASK